jgi:uncharacterized protein YjiS (DUF1127 family)
MTATMPSPLPMPSRALLRRLLAAWTAMQARRAAHDELRGMSDQELADLGIGRCEIPLLLAHRSDAGAVPQRGQAAGRVSAA